MRGLMGVCGLALAACVGTAPADDISSTSRATTSGVQEQGARFQGARFQGARFQGARFQGARFQGTSFQGAHVEGTSLAGTVLVPVNPHPAFDACGASTIGADRGCGWQLGGIGTCTPGAAVNVGTGCGLGSASGDTVLRACSGRGGCTGAEALAANDDACTGGASRVAFTCPASGEYTTLVGAHDSSAAVDATPAASAGSFPLTYAVSGEDLIGATLVGVDDTGREIPIAITNITPDAGDPSGETLLYTLQYQDPDSGLWEEYCDADREGLAAAIPLAGTWNEDTGAHAASSTLFTFGCTSGVLAKCLRWGYKPWKTVNGVQLANHHQTCTRMARADYCGNGNPHTVDGTLIDIYDSVVIQSRTAGTGMLYEASWTPDGAYCVSKGRWDIDGVTILLECPWRIAVPSLTDLLSGCLVKLTAGGRSTIRTNDDSYLQLSILH